MEASVLLFQLATPCSEFNQKVGASRFLGTKTPLVPAKGSNTSTSSRNCDVAVCVSALDLHHISLCNAAMFLCSQPAFAVTTMTSLCTLQASTLSSPPLPHPSLPLISPYPSPLFCPFFFLCSPISVPSDHHCHCGYYPGPLRPPVNWPGAELPIIFLLVLLILQIQLQDFL